ncbi:MAG: beta-ketoacyl synthase N-terminal-like domain-containing protein [Cyanobacteria bacterium]|nr:beta-ketoacyl synthase N-terminal-like domain-containing protein [Cyanobacteriota bacterium]
MASSDIAIVGMACIFPGANDLSHFWSNLVNGVDAITEMPSSHRFVGRTEQRASSTEDQLTIPRGGFLSDQLWFDPLRFGIVPNAIRHGNPDQFMLMQLADDALRDAGVSADAPVRQRTDVIVGNGSYYNLASFQLALSAEGLDFLLDGLGEQFPELTSDRCLELDQYFRKIFPPPPIDTVPTIFPNLIASRTANRLNLRGSAYVVDGACASSLLAVDHAAQRLTSGRCDLALAGGISLQNCLPKQQGLRILGAISKAGRSMPFDKRADGLVVGEGGGVVVLKRLEDAIRDSNRVYAVIRGVAVSSDGRDVDVMAPSRSGQVETYAIAYRDAGVDPETIGYLEAHGTATTVGDRTELASLRSFFGLASGPPYGRSMGSVKSMIGHLLPASGMASLIKTALAISNKVIPSTLHCEDPCDEIADGPFHIANETRAWVHAPGRGPRRAGINAFGFGGINTHLILEEMQSDFHKSSLAPISISRPVVSAFAWPSELVVVSGTTAAEVLARLERLRLFLRCDGRHVSLADLAAALNAKLDVMHACKLALVASGFEELQELLDKSSLFLGSNAAKPEDARLYYSETASQPIGKIACVIPGTTLPGLSGNLTEHLMQLALHFPELREEIDRLESRDGNADDPLPLSVIFHPPSSLPEDFRTDVRTRLAPPRIGRLSSEDSRPNERNLLVPGTMIANWLFWVLIRELGIPFDMLAGQSNGEWTALCAAGVMEANDYFQCIWDITDIDFQAVAGQSLAMASITAERFNELSTEYADVHIAIHGTPDVLIFGGASSSIDQMIKRIYAAGSFAVPLSLPPFHTPCLSYLRGPLRQVLEALPPLKQPTLPIYLSSSVDLCPSQRDEMIKLFCNNLDHPCCSWQTLHRMVDDGGRIFVHAGQGALKGLPQQEDLVSVSIDLEARDPLTQLHHFCATLLTAGVPLNLDLLVRHRPIHPLNLDAPEAAPERPVTAIPYRLGYKILALEQPFVADTVTNSSAASDATLAIGLPTSPDPIHNFPFVGGIEHFVPQQSLRYALQLSLVEHQFIAHHRFIVADGIKPLSRLEATVPLTFSMELMAEAAALLSPGLGLIGFEKVRGSKWIQFAGCETIDLNVEARVKVIDAETGVHRVDVTIQFNGSAAASATVLYASEYCHNLSEGPVISSNDPPWPLTAQEAYISRLFHGPMFEGVARLDGYGNPSFSADLVVLPKDALLASTCDPCLLMDPLLLDAVGQVIGLWCSVKVMDVLPIMVDTIEIHRPSTPVSTMVRLNGEITEFDSDLLRIKANADIDDGEGNLWMRVIGWTVTSIMKDYNPEIACFKRLPAVSFLSQELILPDPRPNTICTFAQLPQSRSLDRLAVLLLHLEEEAEYEAIVDRSRRRDFLISRFAVKDAVRLWWMRRGADPIHPATIRIDHDPRGRPFVSQDGEPVLPWISLSHSNGAAVAIASDREMGIDLEPLSNRNAQLNGYASDIEKALLAEFASQSPAEAWDLKLWCAKEAVAKACGTGLQGRPRDFALVGVDPDGALLIEQAATAERLRVYSFALEHHLIAIAHRHAGWSGDAR